MQLETKSNDKNTLSQFLDCGEFLSCLVPLTSSIQSSQRLGDHMDIYLTTQWMSPEIMRMSGCNYLCTIFDFHFKAATSVFRFRHCARCERAVFAHVKDLLSRPDLVICIHTCISYSSILIPSVLLYSAVCTCDCLSKSQVTLCSHARLGLSALCSLQHKNFTITCQTIAKISLNLPGPRKKSVNHVIITSKV